MVGILGTQQDPIGAAGTTLPFLAGRWAAQAFFPPQPLDLLVVDPSPDQADDDWRALLEKSEQSMGYVPNYTMVFGLHPQALPVGEVWCPASAAA